MSLTFDASQMQRAMDQLAAQSNRTNAEILTLNGREAIFHIVNETPRLTGSARAGWSAAWAGIGRPGRPFRARPNTTLKKGNRVYEPDGDFIDERRKFGTPSITFINRSTVRINGKKFDYVFLLDSGRGKFSKKSKGFMQRGLDKTQESFEKILEKKYQRDMKRFSAK